MEAIARLIGSGELGQMFAADLTFHNAYGPDKPWFYDRAQSGGGCVMDLGVHLVDLASWVLGFPEANGVAAQLYANGAPLADDAGEDYAAAQFRRGETAVRRACSWRLAAGQDAVIEASFYGTGGGATFRNVGGSFYDFEATRFRDTQRETLATGAEEWGGRAAAAWAQRLAAGERFSAEADELVAVSRVLDGIYGA